MKSFAWLLGIGILLGGIAGYAYYHYVGCNSGHCMITSHPINSTLYGALLGGIVSQLFRKENKK
ncbi:MAG: hypothetical protein K6T34_00995 [Thermoflavifilum sp.]|nr:hypothetical protein [Thermoflavifilum sp.]